MMSLSFFSLRALTQNDLNRTASETIICSKKKIESCESIISFKRQKTIFCCLSKTHSIDILSSTIIKHARISLISLLSLFHFDQTSQFLKKKRERSRVEKTSKVLKKKHERSRVEKTFEALKKKHEKSRVEKTSEALKKKRERFRVEKTSEVLKKKHERSRVEKTSKVLKKKREKSRVEKTSKISKNQNERSRKFDQASKKKKKMSQKRDKATQKNKRRSRKYDRTSKKKNERSQQIDFIRASNSNLDRKIAQIMKNTKMTRQHETILERRLRERIDRKTRHARQCARVIRRNDTSFNTITQTSQSLRDIVSFSSRQDNSFFSNHFEFSVVLVQNSVNYRTCVRCDLLKSTNRFLASFDVEYCDWCMFCFFETDVECSNMRWCFLEMHEALFVEFRINHKRFRNCVRCLTRQNSKINNIFDSFQTFVIFVFKSSSLFLQALAVSNSDWDFIANFYFFLAKMRRETCDVCNETSFNMKIRIHEKMSECARCRLDRVKNEKNDDFVSLWKAFNDLNS
jgi:hypothetical protein